MQRFTWNSRRLAALALAGGLLVTAIVVWMVYRADSAPKLTLGEVEQRVLNTYEGSIVDRRLQGDDAVVFLKTGQGLYELIVSRGSGDIAEIRRLEEYVQGPPAGSDDPEESVPGQDDLSTDPSDSGGEPVTGDPGGEPPSTQPDDKPPGGGTQNGGTPASSTDGLISEQEATGLALKSVSGQVKDIDLEEDGGARYYLIEIQTADGREAEVQLNASSGKVISVTWDDDHDDDSDDDDDE